jgi:CubicO group peptidase (beta-lactamase class C family)
MNRREHVLSLGGVALMGASCASPMSPSATTAPSAAPASPAKPSMNPSIDSALAAICNDAAKPLASVVGLAIRNGQIVYQGAFGRRFISADGRSDQPAQADAIYRIASISKLITAVGVMRLVEAGTLALDADVSNYLGWRLRNPAFPNAPVTLRHMLTHTSGLRDDAGYFWDARTPIRSVLEPGSALFDKGQAWSPRAAPGAFFQYANLPWGVIGTVMEAATRERFDKLMHRLVFVPLGMSGGFNPAALPKDQLARIATLYRKRTEANGREIWNPQGPWVPQVDDYSQTPPVPRAGDDYVPGTNGALFGPQGNARADAQGLAAIAQMFLSDGLAANGQRFLKRETVQAMLTPAWVFNDTQPPNGDTYDGLMRAWGLGAQQFTDFSQRLASGKADASGSKFKTSGDRLVRAGGYTGWGHLGNAWGLTSGLVFNPKDKSAMVFMVGGPGFNPDAHDPGGYSSLFGYEEMIFTALHAALKQ